MQHNGMYPIKFIKFTTNKLYNSQSVYTASSQHKNIVYNINQNYRKCELTLSN